MKRCFKCGSEKLLEEFYRHAAMADGHLNKCKACARSDVRLRRAEHVEYYRLYDVARYYRDGHRNKYVPPTPAVKKAWCGRNKDKRAAHSVVANALRTGKLVKPTSCPLCKEPKESRKLHAHHEDYSKPLEIEWACSACHKKKHRTLQPEVVAARLAELRASTV